MQRRYFQCEGKNKENGELVYNYGALQSGQKNENSLAAVSYSVTKYLVITFV